MNLPDVMIERSPLEKSIRMETIRAEIEDGGEFVVVSTVWLDRLNAIIVKRNLSDGDQA